MSKAVELFESARVLMSFGPGVVAEIGRHGVTVKDVLGENHFVRADPTHRGDGPTADVRVRRR